MSEEIIWKGKPSYLENFGAYAMGLLLLVVAPLAGWGLSLIEGLPGMVAWIVGLAIAVGAIGHVTLQQLRTACHEYELTNQRFKETKGILTKVYNELELYRVKDITVKQPLAARVMGLGYVHLDTSDKTTPELDIGPIKDFDKIRESIRSVVEDLRDKKRVREIDYE